jgi:hypothetical protein
MALLQPCFTIVVFARKVSLADIVSLAILVNLKDVFVGQSSTCTLPISAYYVFTFSKTQPTPL